jgi:hypothetical protein
MARLANPVVPMPPTNFASVKVIEVMVITATEFGIANFRNILATGAFSKNLTRSEEELRI